MGKMRSRGERNWMLNRKDTCSKRDFKNRENIGYLLAKENKPAERQSLSREVMTEGAESWEKEELEGVQRKDLLVVKRRKAALSEPGGHKWIFFSG